MPERVASDAARRRLGLRPDRIGQIDDRRHEERDRDLMLEHALEARHDERGEHASDEADEQPGMVPRTPRRRPSSASGLCCLALDTGEAVEISTCSWRRIFSNAVAAPRRPASSSIDDRRGGGVGAENLGCHGLPIGIQIHARIESVDKPSSGWWLEARSRSGSRIAPASSPSRPITNTVSVASRSWLASRAITASTSSSS
jgi:hypothetical protein